MNNGAFGENFPYSNFHDLNMDWIIKIAKDFLDQYTHIQEIIENGETEITNLTTEKLTELTNKASELENLLDQWYNTHSEDIANELAEAISDFYNTAQTIGQQVIDSIPVDYTTLTNNALQSSSILVTNANLDTYKELNNLQVQRVYLYGREAFLSGELLHYPSRFTLGAQIITLNYQNPAIAGEVQLAFSMNGDGFAYRVNNGTQWTDWKYSVNPQIENDALQCSSIFVSNANLNTYKELNNLQIQRIYLYGREAFLSGELLHYPSKFTHGAQIITLNYQNPAIAGEVQLAFSMNGDGFAYRVNNGAQWTDWLYSVNETAIQPSGIIYFDTNVSGHTDIASEPQCRIITYTRSAVLSGLQHAPNRFKYGFTFVKMPYMFGNTTGEIFIAVDLASGAIATKTITTGADTPYVYSNPYYTVGATGCDFTTVRSCLEFIAQFKIENSTVFITDGIYDLVSEYADVLENTVVNGTGLPIGGNTHIIMGEHSEIRFLYEGNREDIGNNFAVFNIYGSCTFEHIKANCKNCKYVVHDDVPAMITKGVITELPKDLIVKYIDCTFRHLGNPNVSYNTPVCIGGGTIPGAMYIIDGGSYGTANASFPYPISYHNHYKAQLGSFGARVVIRNTWLPTGQAIRFGTYGDSQIVGSIDGCKLGASTNYGSPASYFPIEEWNNTIR